MGPRAWITTLALIVIAGVCGSCGLLTSMATERRGWTASPTEPDLALLADAERLCLGPLGIAGLQDALAIQDQRGPDAAAFLWADGETTAMCLVSRDSGGVASSDGAMSTDSDIDPGSRLELTSIDCSSPTVAFGTTALEPGRVVIETTAGRAV